MAVRASHVVTAGSGRAVTAAGAVRMIPGPRLAPDAHRVRDQGDPSLRLGDARGDQRRYPRRARRRAQRAAGPAAPLYGQAVVLPMLDAWAGPAVPADHHRSDQVADRRRSPTCQAGHRPGRGAGHPLEVLAPLDRDLPARLHLPLGRRRRATPARGRLRPGRRADPDHRSRAAAAPARHRHPPTPARPGPPPALVHLATPPPAPRPTSPPTLERLRRDNTVITTNYSRRICAILASVIAMGYLHRTRSTAIPRSPHRPSGAHPERCLARRRGESALDLGCTRSNDLRI